jgi:hypothetical protein
MNSLAQQWLLDALALFLLLGSIAGMLVGGLLLWRPDRLRAIGGVLNRWVSTRRLEAPLDRTYMIDPWFYRYRRVSAAIILAGALYILYWFTVPFDRMQVASGFAQRFGWLRTVAEGMVDAIALSAITGAVLALCVGLFLLLRPSLLRDLEQGANRWVSLRRAMKPVEIERDGVDEYLLRHNRRAGMLLVAGSLYIMVLLTTWIWHR